jgi:gamma-glutamylputrescine oxidase
MVALKHADYESFICKEHKALLSMDFDSTLYDKRSLEHIVASHSYYGGVRYGDSFGINAFAYCQELKKILIDKGVNIYEETPALSIHGHKVATPHGTITADHIVVCVDRFLPDFGVHTDDIYHVQNFIAVSEPLSDRQISHIFPHEPFMVSDTGLIFSYYRLIENNRLLIGGGNPFYAYADKAQYDNGYMFNKLIDYIYTMFPELHTTFNYFWPGLIGVTKDVIPLAGKDKDQSHIYYISGATGLHWASALGKYASDSIIDGKKDYDSYFNPYRSYILPHYLERVIGKKASFGLSHLIKMGI